MFALMRSVRRVSNFMPKMLNTSQSFAYSSGMEDEFRSAQENLKKLSEEPSNEVKLKLYGLFKQSTVGQCNTPKPSALDFVGKAKWGAWAGLGSMSSAEAMTQYVDAVKTLLKEAGVDAQDSSDASGSEPEILIENKSGVCVITLNRPKKFNAISVQMYDEWMNALNNASKDDSVKMALIQANGDYFCSGNDLKNFEQGYKQFKGDIRAAAQASSTILQKFVAAFIDFDKPLIGAVNGPAIGIAVTTLGLMDCVVASDSATFQSPFSSLGQSPEACATYTFPYIMGYSKASEMLFFNHKMDANEALGCGLISRVVPSSQFRNHVNDWVFGPKGLVNTCYPKSMYFSKALVRNEELKNKLHQVNKEECQTITDRWTSDECLQALQKFATRKSNL